MSIMTQKQNEKQENMSQLQDKRQNGGHLQKDMDVGICLQGFYSRYRAILNENRNTTDLYMWHTVYSEPSVPPGPTSMY